MAYVLGQLQDKAATAALVRVLAAAGEHPMVRHEAAEALGAIAGEERREAVKVACVIGSPISQSHSLERVGGCSDADSIALLKEFAGDKEPIVGESCQVALDMIEFELHGNSFEVRSDPNVSTSGTDVCQGTGLKVNRIWCQPCVDWRGRRGMRGPDSRMLSERKVLVCPPSARALQWRSTIKKNTETRIPSSGRTASRLTSRWSYLLCVCAVCGCAPPPLTSNCSLGGCTGVIPTSSNCSLLCAETVLWAVC